MKCAQAAIKRRATDGCELSITDVVQGLRGRNSTQRKLAQEAGSGQLYEEIVQLQLTATDGKQRETGCANAARLLRIVQSTPSPKAEPIIQRSLEVTA